VRTDTPRMTPLLTGSDGNLHHNLVHAVQGGDVDMTMVAGKMVVEGGKLLTADLQELIADMNKAVPDLFRRRAEWLATHKSVNELVKDKDNL
jgi:5-methylthioadenosine/S-adenosylhomocysteine deaminase